MLSIMTDVLCLLDIFRKIPGIPERGITLENAFHARYLYDQKEEVITPEDEQAFAEVVAEVEANTVKVEEEEKVSEKVSEKVPEKVPEKESEKEKEQAEEAVEDRKKDYEEPSNEQTPTEKEGDE